MISIARTMICIFISYSLSFFGVPLFCVCAWFLVSLTVMVNIYSKTSLTCQMSVKVADCAWISWWHYPTRRCKRVRQDLTKPPVENHRRSQSWIHLTSRWIDLSCFAFRKGNVCNAMNMPSFRLVYLLDLKICYRLFCKLIFRFGA